MTLIWSFYESHLVSASRGLSQAQQWQQALFAYTQLTSQFPNEPEPFHMLGVLYLQMGKPEQATHCIESAIAINPRKASYHSNLGAAYRALQNWSAAEKAWRQVLVLDPKSGDTYFNLGTLQIAQGHKEDAKKLWLKSSNTAQTIWLPSERWP